MRRRALLIVFVASTLLTTDPSTGPLPQVRIPQQGQSHKTQGRQGRGKKLSAPAKDSTPKGAGCPDGQEITPESAGHCCWPGQKWKKSEVAVDTSDSKDSRKKKKKKNDVPVADAGMCIGQPKRCADGYHVTSTTCEVDVCDVGEVLADATHCCWPGQEWSSSEKQCTGSPRRCRTGWDIVGGDCAPKKSEPGMVYLKRSQFLFGEENGESNEVPVTHVTLSPFWLDVREVTVAQYADCVHAGNCTEPDTGPSCNWGAEGRGKHPVNCVDWVQAKTFCAWNGKKLPSEAQWEYAARGGDGRAYPWGNEPPDDKRACFHDSCGKGTAPVGPSPSGRSFSGIDDMAGNVWEWVEDAYAPYPGNSAKNPVQEKGKERVLRGGGWLNLGVSLRSAYRGSNPPEVRYDYVGFRCATGGDGAKPMLAPPPKPVAVELPSQTPVAAPAPALAPVAIQAATPPPAPPTPVAAVPAPAPVAPVPTPAPSASGKRRVVVVNLVDGDGVRAVQAATGTAEAIKQVLAHAGLELVSADETAQAVAKQSSKSCGGSPACLAGVASAVHADIVVSGVVQKDGRKFRVDVSVTKGSDKPATTSESMKKIDNLPLNVQLCLDRLMGW